MKKIALTTLIIIAINHISLGQIFDDICATPNYVQLKSTETTEWFDFENEPVKQVRIRLVFLRNNNGLGGFDPNNNAHQTYINDKINRLNNTYSNLQSSYNNQCYDGTQGIYSNSKVSFSIQTLYLNNTYYWNNLNSTGTYGCPDEPSYHLNNLRDSLEALDTYPVLNVFFTENADAYQNIVVNQNCPFPGQEGFSSVSCSQHPEETPFDFKQSVHMRNKFLKYYWMMNCVAENAFEYPDWEAGYPPSSLAYGWLDAGRQLAHELGHSLFLNHVNPNECVCWRHLMMNKGDCSPREYFLSPIEIDRMHKAMSETSLQRYVNENTYSNTPINISNNASWSNKLRIYRGLHVSSATLSINNNIIIPSQASIIVNSGTLNLANSNIETANNQNMNAIELNNTGIINFTNSTLPEINSLNSNNGSNLTLSGSNLTVKNNSNSSLSTISLESGSVFKLNSGSQFLLDASSHLYVRTGSTLEIEDGADLIVTNNSRLLVEPGASIIVKGSGGITFKCNGQLCASSGASINLQDIASSIHFVGTGGLSPGCLSSLSGVLSGNGAVRNYSSPLTVNNTTISTNTFYSGSTITSANVSVQGTGTDVWYSITSGATINGPFEVPLGATFEVKVNSTACSN